MGLEETPRTQKRNVVLIHLESARARSITPYNEKIKTTPFLDDLAKKSLFVQRAYTTVPRTSKAIISVTRSTSTTTMTFPRSSSISRKTPLRSTTSWTKETNKR